MFKIYSIKNKEGWSQNLSEFQPIFFSEFLFYKYYQLAILAMQQAINLRIN